ncbi:MAG: NAD(P)H-binding protein [Pseudomonadota bacterium]
MSGSDGRRVLVLGATGTIGRAVVGELLAQGAHVTCLLRSASGHGLPETAKTRLVDLSDPASISAALGPDRFDALISCIASRTGAPEDAWAVDHRANLNALSAAGEAGVGHFILLSAICVQKPLLAFQHAKLAFEAELKSSGLTWSIVRPTAYFKSISGQLDRLRQGKPFLLFGDGELTACKPISDGDLARYLVGCLDDPERQNRILPVGGPGPALTPLDQGRALFRALDLEPKFRRVPVAMMDAIIGVLSLAGRVSKTAAAKAELARIGRYYATESMLVWDAAAGRYDAEATPSFGSETLPEFYARLVRGDVAIERGDHAVF